MASLTPTMDGTSRANSTTSSVPILRPDRIGYVIEHDRQVGGRGHGAEVGRKSGCRRPVVVRSDGQYPAGPTGFGLPGQQHRMGGVVGTGGGDDGHVHDLDHGAEQVEAFGIGENRALAGRARPRPGHRSRSRPDGGATWPAMSRSMSPSGWKGVTIAVITEPNRAIRTQPLERGAGEAEGVTNAQVTSTERPDRYDDGPSRACPAPLRRRPGPAAAPRPGRRTPRRCPPTTPTGSRRAR